MAQPNQKPHVDIVDQDQTVQILLCVHVYTLCNILESDLQIPIKFGVSFFYLF